jgi:hypothetical protein
MSIKRTTRSVTHLTEYGMQKHTKKTVEFRISLNSTSNFLDYVSHGTALLMDVFSSSKARTKDGPLLPNSNKAALSGSKNAAQQWLCSDGKGRRKGK